jgi:hypothetical protein
MSYSETVEITKHLVDASAAGTAVATVVAALPPIAALFTIVWTALRIYEMILGLPFNATPFGMGLKKFLTRRE